ncbi:hypothetical protein GOV04_04950 [Candidatus Woesearchaeota archaeon]|nr:hypothetical protein [Candidatus Woesearchaeota archaeon]
MKKIFILEDQKLVKCLTPELIDRTRSKISIEKNQLIIDAKDATALKASTNGIKNLIIVYDKIKKIVENDKRTKLTS